MVLGLVCLRLVGANEYFSYEGEFRIAGREATFVMNYDIAKTLTVAEQVVQQAEKMVTEAEAKHKVNVNTRSEIDLIRSLTGRITSETENLKLVQNENRRVRRSVLEWIASFFGLWNRKSISEVSHTVSQLDVKQKQLIRITDTERKLQKDYLEYMTYSKRVMNRLLADERVVHIQQEFLNLIDVLQVLLEDINLLQSDLDVILNHRVPVHVAHAVRPQLNDFEEHLADKGLSSPRKFSELIFQTETSFVMTNSSVKLLVHLPVVEDLAPHLSIYRLRDVPIRMTADLWVLPRDETDYWVTDGKWGMIFSGEDRDECVIVERAWICKVQQLQEIADMEVCMAEIWRHQVQMNGTCDLEILAAATPYLMVENNVLLTWSNVEFEMFRVDLNGNGEKVRMDRGVQRFVCEQPCRVFYGKRMFLLGPKEEQKATAEVGFEGLLGNETGDMAWTEGNHTWSSFEFEKDTEINDLLKQLDLEEEGVQKEIPDGWNTYGRYVALAGILIFIFIIAVLLGFLWWKVYRTQLLSTSTPHTDDGNEMEMLNMSKRVEDLEARLEDL